MKSYISEIFSSIQGEGPYIGERHLFLRFCDCHRDCIYCDTNTKRTESVMIEKVAGSGEIEHIPNPLSVDEVLNWIDVLDAKKNNKRIALTGGAPLLQAKFLSQLLPILVEKGYSNYLETVGDLTDQFKTIVEYIDIVAMDVKLSSVTLDKNIFSQHWEFLSYMKNQNVKYFIKLIVSNETDECELMEAVRGICIHGGKETNVILQALSATERVSNIPSSQQLLRWQDKIVNLLPNIRVIPQTHKIMGVL